MNLKSKLQKHLFLFSLLSAILFTPQLSLAKTGDGTLDCPVLPAITQGFLVNHISGKSLASEHESRTIEQFIKRLDPSKFYLLQSDVEEIRHVLHGIFNKEKYGMDCSGIHKAQDILLKRQKETFEFIKKSLGPDFKLQENTEILEAAQRKFPATKKEAQEQILKSLQFQISNFLASDTKLPQAKHQLVHRYEILSKRQEQLKPEDLYSMFLDSMASALDAHSSYLDRSTLEDFEIGMKLSLEGIGAQLSWDDGYTVVENLIPGGSAARSGELHPKDKIISVAQGSKGSFEQVIDMPLRDVVKLIRGKKGTTVRLTVLRQSAKNTGRHIVSLVRDEIKLEDEAAHLVYNTKKIGDKTYKIAIIDLPSFYGDLSKRKRSCYDDVRKLLDKVHQDKADGVILDLSKNGGGLLTEAVRLGGLFIREGNIVATQNSKDRLEILPDEDEKVQYGGPLIILTSRLSASASEIVSGALQDYKRAIIVGSDHTFGKGTVQAMINLPPTIGGGAIKVTTGMFFTPSGQSTQYRGVPADIVLPNIFSTKDVGEVSLDYSLPPKKIASFLSPEAKGGWSPFDEDVVKKVAELSKERVAKNPEFKKITEELSEIESRKGVIKLADTLKKQREEKAKEDQKEKKEKLAAKGKKKGSKRALDEDYLKIPQVDEAISIMADYLNLKGITPIQQQASR